MGERVEGYKSSMSIGVGVIQIVLTVLVLAIAIWWTALGAHGALLVAPYISCAMHLIAGILTVSAGVTRQQGVIVGMMVFNIVTILFSVAHTLLAGWLALLLTAFGGIFLAARSFLAATPSIMAILGVLLFGFTLWASILGCVSQCGKGGSTNQNVQVAYIVDASPVGYPAHQDTAPPPYDAPPSQEPFYPNLDNIQKYY